MKKIFISISILSLFSILLSSIYAQVTIGGNIEPRAGALLDLKESNTLGDITATKGLGLPRVNLIDNKNLYPMFTNDGNGDYVGSSKSIEDENHIGLVVYNLTEITTNKESRLCKGVHVWNGTKWDPFVPYPDHSSSLIKIGKSDDFVDVRGPGGIETNTYHTSRFAVLKSGNLYSCNPDEQFVYWDAGTWMTENLYTKYAPSGQSIPLQSGSLSAGIAQYSYTAIDSNPKSWGLSYNWAAATVGADGIHGKGGLTGDDVQIDEMNIDINIVQGICPNGWHLPSAKEYQQLYDFVNISHDFTTEPPIVGSSASSFLMKDDASTGNNTGGISKPADEGGFAGLLVGWLGVPGLGKSSLANFWTSSAAANSYAYYTRIQVTNSPIFNKGTRVSSSPIRCKKNEN